MSEISGQLYQGGCHFLCRLPCRCDQVSGDFGGSPPPIIGPLRHSTTDLRLAFDSRIITFTHRQVQWQCGVLCFSSCSPSSLYFAFFSHPFLSLPALFVLAFTTRPILWPLYQPGCEHVDAGHMDGAGGARKVCLRAYLFVVSALPSSRPVATLATLLPTPNTLRSYLLRSAHGYVSFLIKNLQP